MPSSLFCAHVHSTSTSMLIKRLTRTRYTSWAAPACICCKPAKVLTLMGGARMYGYSCKTCEGPNPHGRRPHAWILHEYPKTLTALPAEKFCLADIDQSVTMTADRRICPACCSVGGIRMRAKV